ncbi:MAG TPA: M20/M25/M40 family metallo-hydrolase [Gemmatimonadales bacterium]|nr:M20/M25/M40 family metallo-hydrolase [Gemmatimonadales bacterium]
MKPTRAPLFALVLTLFAPTSAVAQLSTRTLDSATLAWDEGRYVDALLSFERLLAGAGESFRRQIALHTGELYRTRAVAPDGRRLQWSPDGRRLLVESGALPVLPDGRPGRTPQGAGPARVTVYALQGDSLVPEHATAGFSATFVDASRVAWIQVVGDSQRVMVRDLASGLEQSWPTPGAVVSAIASAGDGERLIATWRPPGTRAASNLSLLDSGGGMRRITDAAVPTQVVGTAAGGLHVVYRLPTQVGVWSREAGASRTFEGVQPSISADGSTLTFVARDSGRSAIAVMNLASDTAPRLVVRAAQRVGLANPAPSPDGRQVVFQMMLREDWELYLAETTRETAPRRLTWEIQHDVLPVFLDSVRFLAAIGEARHRRSYLYDVRGGERIRLFHNNTVRTVAPEYAWVPSPDGTRVAIIADRDGDTVSPERQVYLVSLREEVSVEDVLARVRSALAAERALRERGERMFAPVAARVRQAVADVSVARVDRCEQTLQLFGSRFMTQPGNARAIVWLAAELQGMGYEPELQWFSPDGYRTANVVATLRGTADPDQTYVVSSHFDSVLDGPGADDNGSGTCALLETARVLASRPQRSTIQFAFFTAEEAGLLGSREFVRRAQQNRVRIVGALNNDMVGWRNDHRLDNTIRYSNDGLRDLQHAAAFLFTDLITYDSRYYQNTDAHAYYEAYGDIVAGIGSYPILGNPHYHQSHDQYETVDPRLIAEVARTTVASLMLMASSPARIADLTAREVPAGGAEVTWSPAPEGGVTGYQVRYGPPEAPERSLLTVRNPRALLPGARSGWRVAVRAVGREGLAGWDWARTEVRR